MCAVHFGCRTRGHLDAAMVMMLHVFTSLMDHDGSLADGGLDNRGLGGSRGERLDRNRLG